jgi:hypothetical protein
MPDRTSLCDSLSWKEKRRLELLPDRLLAKASPQLDGTVIGCADAGA